MATLQGSDSAELNSHLQPSASRSADVPLTGPIVMKFGGTSVADADAIMRSWDRARRLASACT